MSNKDDIIDVEYFSSPKHKSLPLVQDVNMVDACLNSVSSVEEKITFSESDIAQANETANDLDRSRDDQVKGIVNDGLKYYNEKYNLNLSYDNFKTYLQFAITATKKDTEIKEIITNKLVSTSMEYLIIKSIIVSTKIIDQALDNIIKNQLSQDVDIVAIALVDKVFWWIDKIEMLKAKYSVFDVDKAIERIMNRAEFKKEDVNTQETTMLLKKLTQSMGSVNLKEADKSSQR